MPEETNYFADPVAAYDHLGPRFDRLAEARRRYLDAIDDLIVSRIRPGWRSLLDVGAGDGRRSLRIAERAGLQRVVLLEPSAEMSRRVPGSVEMWRVRAEELNPQKPPADGRRFDGITCLWNVLGHIRPGRARSQVLASLCAMLSPEGVLFVDVNHRYNLSSYGAGRTAIRFLRDRVQHSELNHDVTAKWEWEDFGCSTYGHVFTDSEMRGLVASAELEIRERIVVDYETGEVRRFSFQGNLLYVLRPRTSANASDSAAQTSSTSSSLR